MVQFSRQCFLNIQDFNGNKFLLIFHGLPHKRSRHSAHCSYFSLPLPNSQTISAFYVLNHRIHCVRFLYFFPLILFLFNVSLVNQFQLSLEKWYATNLSLIYSSSFQSCYNTAFARCRIRILAVLCCPHIK